MIYMVPDVEPVVSPEYYQVIQKPKNIYFCKWCKNQYYFYFLFLFFMWLKRFFTPFVRDWRDSFNSTSYTNLLYHRLTMNPVVQLCSLHSAPLVCRSISIPVPCSFDDYIFIVHFKDVKFNIAPVITFIYYDCYIWGVLWFNQYSSILLQVLKTLLKY